MYSDWEVVRWLGASPVVMASLEEQRERLTARTEADEARGDGTGLFALERVADAVVVGSVLFKELPDGYGIGTGDFEVGWHLAREFWGHGYATEAGRGALQHGFGLMPDLDAIVAIAFPENARSLAVMERLGMERVGLTRKYYGVEAMLYEARRSSWPSHAG